MKRTTCDIFMKDLGACWTWGASCKGMALELTFDELVSMNVILYRISELRKYGVFKSLYLPGLGKISGPELQSDSTEVPAAPLADAWSMPTIGAIDKGKRLECMRTVCDK